MEFIFTPIFRFFVCLEYMMHFVCQNTWIGLQSQNIRKIEINWSMVNRMEIDSTGELFKNKSAIGYLVSRATR